jgi:hypothetical protein
VVLEVLVAPAQGAPGVVQAGDREAGPVGSDILAPRPAFTNGQMPWGDVAFDADLAADVVRNLAGAPVGRRAALQRSRGVVVRGCTRTQPAWISVTTGTYVDAIEQVQRSAVAGMDSLLSPAQ